jgi:hypothetical protein
MGGEIAGRPADPVTVSVLVRGGAGRSLLLLRDGVAVHAVPVTADEQIVTLRQSVGAGGYLRAELRSLPTPDSADPVSGRTGMAALTNPVFLVSG